MKTRRDATKLSRNSSSDAAGVRWGWVGAVTGAGILLTAVACLSPVLFGEKFGSWQSLLATTLVNVGTTLLLAALLIGIERVVVRNVRVAASESATAAVAIGTQDLRDENARISQRIDDIDAQLIARQQQADAGRADVVSQVGETPSWGVVVAALREADQLNAVVNAEITAQIDDDGSSLHLTAQLTNERTVDHDSPDPYGESADVVGIVADTGVAHAAVRWVEGQSATDMLENLQHELRRQGAGRVADTFSAASVFPNLQLALALAIAARTGREPWITGRVLERIDDDWVVTENGLESRQHGLALSMAAIPEPAAYLGGRSPDIPPAPGPDIDQAFWTQAVARVQHHAWVRRMRRIVPGSGNFD